MGDAALTALVAAALLVSALAATAEFMSRQGGDETRILKRAASFPISIETIRERNLSLREAMFWKAGDNGSVKCELCPFNCEIAPGERGQCRVRANVDGKLRSLTFARPCSIAIDPIEKKPLFHVLPGASALSVATVGCNLGCVFCQNWEISQAFPEKEKFVGVVLPERLVEIASERGCETIAYTYTEPTVYFEYMLETARLARAKGIRNLWITCGYINRAPLEMLAEVLDAANVDLKGYDEAFYRRYCKSSLTPVLDTLRTLKRKGVFIEITNLVIPGANDDPDMIRRMCGWIVSELGPMTPLHFSRFHGAYQLSDRPRTPPATLLQARRIALAEGLKFVYIGNISVNDGETTFCPGCGEPLIERHGYEVGAILVRDGACALCGAAIPGIWK